jgi:Methyltransferase domain
MHNENSWREFKKIYRSRSGSGWNLLNRMEPSKYVPVHVPGHPLLPPDTRIPMFLRKLERVWAVYRNFGLREAVKRVARRLGVNDPDHSNWLLRKAERDAEFDQRFGTDTGGIHDIQDHQIASKNARLAGSHIATDPSDFEEMMSDLKLPISDYTFVDLGCGKGRALILAAQHPFAKVVGVEFVPAFVESAKKNIQAAAKKVSLCSQIEIELGDAAIFNFPGGPILLYLSNPFDGPIFRRVGLNAYRSWQHERRPFTIIYMYPIHVDDLTAAGWKVVERRPSWIRFDPR